MRLLLAAWFMFVTSALFWLPAYEGNVDLTGQELAITIAVYASIAVLAAEAVRQRAKSRRSALLSSLPILALLAAAALTG